MSLPHGSVTEPVLSNQPLLALCPVERLPGCKEQADGDWAQTPVSPMQPPSERRPWQPRDAADAALHGAWYRLGQSREVTAKPLGMPVLPHCVALWACQLPPC
ncbi:hypothetical protein KIL84_001999 [Mauremys mutica]|uniref:Uncharacterized protein n=1 Tax=Mauremys mutica TaxID=74926 RepID=A0A9D4B5I7_9SAUR|nr:hypothetical protein KIL84_001999 [Mauremys mutica]